MSTFPAPRSVDDSLNDSEPGPHRARTFSAQNEQTLLRALAEQGMSPLGRAIGRDHTYIGRFRSGEQGLKLDDMLKLLEACGLRLVSAGPDTVMIDRERYAALVTMSNLGQRQINEELKEIMGRVD